MIQLLLDLTPPTITHSDEPNISPILYLLGFIITLIAIIGLIASIVSTVRASKENDRPEAAQSDTATEKDDKPAAKKHPILIIFFLALSIVGFILLAKACDPTQSSSSTSTQSSSSTPTSTSSSQRPFRRSANNADITLQDAPLNLGNLGQDIVFVANSNVSDLVLTFRFYDKNDALLTTKIRELGNVSKGQQYTVSFGATDFSLADNFKITYFSVDVTGGTVSYFG